MEQAEVEQPQGGNSLVTRLYEAQAQVNSVKARSRTGRIKALQENAKLLAFLQGNGITSMEQLYEKVSAMNDAYYDLRGKIVKLGVSKRTVERLVQTAANLTPEAKKTIRDAGDKSPRGPR